jgi:hypothetical protein
MSNNTLDMYKALLKKKKNVVYAFYRPFLERDSSIWFDWFFYKACTDYFTKKVVRIESFHFRAYTMNEWSQHSTN